MEGWQTAFLGTFFPLGTVVGPQKTKGKQEKTTDFPSHPDGRPKEFPIFPARKRQRRSSGHPTSCGGCAGKLFRANLPAASLQLIPSLADCRWQKQERRAFCRRGNQGASAQKSAAKIFESYVQNRYITSLDCTKCFGGMRATSTAKLLRKQGFQSGPTNLCEQMLMWTNHARRCAFNDYTADSLLKPAGMGGQQKTQCYIQAIQQNFRGWASICADDRSVTATSAAQLVERISHWSESLKVQSTARSRPAIQVLKLSVKKA